SRLCSECVAGRSSPVVSLELLNEETSEYLVVTVSVRELQRLISVFWLKREDGKDDTRKSIMY
ncbi:MAG: hypothetical protein IKG94_03460, partial [Candidatus Methanomethylophilaceae archaeon]|nr:hypothetical protein [Candidatus Methanomethylophilaceae archaeon]